MTEIEQTYLRGDNQAGQDRRCDIEGYTGSACLPIGDRDAPRPQYPAGATPPERVALDVERVPRGLYGKVPADPAGVFLVQELFERSARHHGAGNVVTLNVPHGKGPTTIGVANGPDWSCTLVLTGWRGVGVCIVRESSE